ncbi:hypothetical protein C4B63_19g203 [Trypanosoma cruzi]|uniref:Uncharacterized protein n=1 Tax=Trypanosoma cruzi TaxID=5693 RepID=A0A2V2VIN6_TRYCR|nr:hypothetical protein C4B63_19g203 [Trypanosoma cruzi]
MLSYNFLPQTFFCLEKHRSLDSIMLTSKEILAEALPIRCLEALCAWNVPLRLDVFLSPSNLEPGKVVPSYCSCYSVRLTLRGVGP